MEKNNNQQYGNNNQPNGQFNNRPNGNQGQPNGQFNNRPNGNYGQPNGQFNNRPNGNYNQPNGQYNNQQYGNNNQPNGQYNNQQYGNYNQPNGQFNNQQYGNYNQPNGQYNNQQYGNYGQPNGQNNNQQYGNYNQPNGQFNNQQYGNYNQPNGQYNNQRSNSQFSNYLNNIKDKLSNLTKKQIITGSVILAVLVAAIAGFMYFSNNTGASSPTKAVEGYLNAMQKEDYVKANNYVYYPTKEARKLADDEINKAIKEGGEKKGELSEMVERYKGSKIESIEEKGENGAYAIITIDHGKYDVKNWKSIDLNKIDGRWYITSKNL